MFNGILWILKTGAPWRDLPAEFGPWNTVHKRFLEWTRLEVWDDILRMLSIKADRDALIIDATLKDGSGYPLPKMQTPSAGV